MDLTSFLKFYFYTSFFIGSIVSLWTGILTFRQNKKRLTNLTWALVSLFSFFWSIGYLLMITASSKNVAFIGSWISHGGAIFIPAFYFHFSLALTKKVDKYKFFLYFAYISALILSFFNPTSFFVKDVVPRFVFNFTPVAGPVFFIYFIHFWWTSTFAALIMFLTYKKNSGLFAQQIKYILIASIGFLGGGSTFFFSFGIDIPPYPIVLYTFYPLYVTYALLRYRFMDVRIVLLRSISFAFITLIVTLTFTLISVILGSFIQEYVKIRSEIVIGLVVGVVISFSYLPMRTLIERLTTKFLFKKTYDPELLISDISEVSSSTLYLDKLLKGYSDILSKAFACNKFGVALLDSFGKLKIYHQSGFKTNFVDQLLNYPNLSQILAKQFFISPGIQAIDELKTKFENGDYVPQDEKLLNLLHDNDISIIAPLYVKNNLTGVMVLGSKKSGDPYSKEDISTLKIIGDQAAVAIDNARLYEELRYFNVKLEEEVKEKTKQLSKANQDLKKLDVAKSEFISIASHQLRTPLTVIKGYISMMREGSFGKIRPQILDNLEKVYVSNERLIQLVENLLDISRIESGRQEFAWKKVQLEELAAEVTEKLQESAQKKKLKLTFHQPKEKLPPVVIDDGKIHEVMMNFVDNAVKYTEKGSVDVYVTKDKEMLTFCVKDTGKGMSPEGKEKLFQKFSRGKDSFRQHTEGLGLGLYVATMMMKAHEGKIWADSPGEGKGASFCFSVPIKSKHKDGEITKIDEKVVEEAKQKDKETTLQEISKK